MKRSGYLGIDAGTQGLSVIFTDESLHILATGEGLYDMVPGLAAECYEQHPGDWEQALGMALADLRKKLSATGIAPRGSGATAATRARGMNSRNGSA